jgi:pimeloyl-ACP methyl ester carboxylesterase
LPADHELTILDGVGHIPMFEAPARVTEVISEFLDRYSQPVRAVDPTAG